MMRLIRMANYRMARSRVRRDFNFDPKLKDYSNTQEVQLQIDHMRNQYEHNSHESFSRVLSDPKPKLGKKFHVQRSKINKKIKRLYNLQIDMSNLQTHDNTDLDYLDEGKSHLHDQTQEIQFHEQFNRQLFRTKETKRIIAKKKNDYRNALTNQADQQYLQYEEAKNKLRNSRVRNMINVNRNNSQLQLLIESGLMNKPENLGMLINQINGKSCQLHQSIGLLSIPQERTEHSSALTTQNSMTSERRAPKINELSSRMIDVGPAQLKQPHKVSEFVHNYQQMNKQNQQICKSDLQLLQQIKKYELKVFLNRYNDIHFRFKGRFSFDFFKQPELVSYIKNETIQPTDLLQIYHQNRDKLSRFSLPIITPRVLCTIYCKTSQYRFPESDSNNRVNMLSDKLFVAVERATFKIIDKLNDDDFCSAVSAYSTNHQDQQGAMNRKMSDKINEAVIAQIKHRVTQLSEENLGLLLRAINQMPIIKFPVQSWGSAIEVIGSRFGEIQDHYTYESIMQFLVNLPVTQHTVMAVNNNFSRFCDYVWGEKYTLNSFLAGGGFLLRHNQQQYAAVQETIKQIILRQAESLKCMIPSMSINLIPQLLMLVRESRCDLEAPIIVNLMKKTVIDKIHQQKQDIRDESLPNLVMSFALEDIQKYVSARIPKYSVVKHESYYQDVMRKLGYQTLLPYQILPYNSALYFLYHHLARLTHSQIHVLSATSLSRVVEALSMVRYKNEKLYDEINCAILDKLHKIQHHEKPFQQQLPSFRRDTKQSECRQLMSIVNSLALQKRASPQFSECVELLLGKYLKQLTKSSANVLLRLINSIVSLNSEIQVQLRRKLVTLINKRIFPFVEHFLEEEVSVLAYICAQLSDYSSDFDRICQRFSAPSPFTKYIVSFYNVLRSLEHKPGGDFLTSFKQHEQHFWNSIKEEVLANEQAVGYTYSWQTAYEIIHETQQKKLGRGKVIAETCQLRIPEENRVIFIATYDQVLINHSSSQQKSGKMELFGFWKLYEKLHRLQSIEFKLVVSFHEG